MTSPEHVLTRLQEIIGPDRVQTGTEVLGAHSVDGRTPWAVLFPQDIREVSQCVRLAFTEKLAMVPWGSGTKITMGNPPTRLDLVLSTLRMNHIIDMDTANLTVTSQSGVRWQDLQAALASEENRCYLPLSDPSTPSDQEVCSDRQHRGCFVPISPPHIGRATVGGVIAANSLGPTALLYGLPRDVVLGIRFVGWEGRVIGMGGKTVKNVSGYDICKLMIGSLGTLGVLCEMTLKLLPLPEKTVTFLASFPTLESAAGVVHRIGESPLLPAAVELLNPTAFHLISPQPLPDGEPHAVAVIVEGFEEAVVRMLSEMDRMSRETGAANTQILRDETHRSFWDAHSNMAEALLRESPGMVSLRLNYPVAKHLETIRLVESLAEDHGVPHALAAHGGNGIARLHLLPRPDDRTTPERISTLAHAVIQHCHALGGNGVVERALPEHKPGLPVWGVPRADELLMKRIKAQMDPAGLFSPGRFLGGI